MSSRVGELLVRTGLISQEQLNKALEVQSSNGGSLTSQLVTLGFITEEDFVQTISQQYAVPVVELEDYEIDSSALQLIPQNLAAKHGLIPLVRKDNTLTVAMADPSNIAALNDIKFITGLDIQVMLARESQIKSKQEKVYEDAVSYDSILGDMDTADMEVVEVGEEIDINELERATEDAPVVKLVNAILADAIKKGASDIHLEPFEKVFRVRFRIDGVLYEIMKPPMKLKNAITSRLKIMADLDIAERRLPQDGRIKLKLGSGKEMDFRVNVLPTLFGEKVVLRLLDKSNLQLDMEKLGFFPDQLAHFKTAISKPHGMIPVSYTHLTLPTIYSV